jgi:hypothetical protein
MKATPATNHDCGATYPVSSPARSLYQSPKATKLNIDQARAIVAEQAVAGDSEIESVFHFLLNSENVG